MVIVGDIGNAAFYCRMNHRDKDYTQFLDSVHKTLDGQFGKDRWKMELYFEVASGSNPDRKEWGRLKADIADRKINAVITVRAAMIARDWEQFIEFMELCRKKDVRVFCTEGPDMAEEIYHRIRSFREAYLERGDGA